jgi:hypothetical protein
MPIKLNAATGGGSVALSAPNSTTSNADVTLTLPPNDGDASQYLQTDGAGALSWQTVASLSNAEDGTGNNFEFNSGFGSNGVAYGVRAWVNFRGDITSSGNSQINGSGNVSSVTDNGTGDYTVNFTNAMPDTNYIAFGNVMESTGNFKGDHNLYMYRRTPVTGSVRVNACNLAGNVADDDYVYVGVIR